MKTNIIYRILAILAITIFFCSCVHKEYAQKPSMSTEIKVDKQTDMPATDIFDFGEKTTISEGGDGVMLLSVKAEPAKADKLKDNVLPGTIEFTDVPEEITNAASATNYGLELTITNPDNSRKFAATVTIAGKEYNINPVDIPHGTTKILYVKDKVNPIIKDKATVQELPEDICKAIEENGPEGLKINNMWFIPENTASIAAMSEDEAVYCVEAEYCTPMTYSKGAVIHIDKDLTKLGFNIAEYDIKADTYKINATVVNTLPFEINIKATSSNGLSGSLDTPIKAGSEDNPVTTEAVMTVTSNGVVTSIDDLKVSADLTAAEDGASIKATQTLKVNVESIKVKLL